MCATRVSNLWMTSAALGKLPSLVQLRFQNCLCCNNTGPCPESASQRIRQTDSGSSDDDSCVVFSSTHGNLHSQALLSSEEVLEHPFVLEDVSMDDIVERPTEDLSEDYEGDFQELGSTELLSSAIFNWDLLNNNAVSDSFFCFFLRGNSLACATFVPTMYVGGINQVYKACICLGSIPL